MIVAYRWRRDTRIESLGDPAVEAPIANVPLATHQERLFRGVVGAEVRETDDPAAIGDREFFVFHDNLWITPALMRKFRRRLAAHRGPGIYRLALAEGELTRFTGFTDELPRVEFGGGGTARGYGLWLVRRKAASGETTDLDRATPVVLEPRLKAVTIPFSSRIPTMTDVRIPVTDEIALELTSWVHLWMANLFSIGAWLFGLLRSPVRWPWLAGRAAWGALAAGSLRPFNILVSIARRVVIRGSGCRIHPTALVEASRLGSRVEIGPHCIVRGSILGDGVRVLERSTVDGSVLGDEVLVNAGGAIKLALIYPKAAVCLMQTSVVGRRAFLGELFRIFDMKLKGEVRVRHRGRLVNTGLSFLGACIGHEVAISGESRIRPGRVVPNGYQIVSDVSEHLDDIPDDLPRDTLLVARRGRLEPLE